MPISITIDSTPCTLKKSFDQRYARELRGGATSVYKATLTDSAVLCRSSHSNTKTQERHYVSLERVYTDSESGVASDPVKIGVTFSSPNDSAQREQILTELWTELKIILDATLQDVLDGSLDLATP